MSCETSVTNVSFVRVVHVEKFYQPMLEYERRTSQSNVGCTFTRTDVSAFIYRITGCVS